MKSYLLKVAVPLLACSLFAATASAATVSGTITNSGGAGLSGMQVRLWEQTPKGLTIAYSQTTAAGGAYSFGGVATGTYAVDARMAPGVTGHYGDTWYDVAAPTSNGLFASDADLLTIAASDDLTGIDIALPLTGGFDGQVLSPGGQALANVVVRAESRTDYRYHHNDITDGSGCCGGTRNGRFSMRGLISTSNGHDYRMLIYDHLGRYDLLVVPGPVPVTDGAAINVGPYQVANMPADPNEPNGSSTAATSITALPFSSSGATIAPRGSDVDWYCFDAQDGDRIVARADTDTTIDGTVREHPWLDPILSVWDDSTSQLIQSNDDDPNASTLESALDTGELSAGRYCFAVSTYGDADWSGAQQATTGGYEFNAEMGNRRPTLEVTHEGTATPAPPQTVAIDEGETVVFDLSFADPDGDALNPQAVHLDNAGQPAVPGTLIPSASSATYEWTPSQTGAAGSPYAITFSVADAEFVTEVLVNVEVNAVNLPPQTPVLDSPIGGVRVSETQVALVVVNSTDRDGDDLTYEFELDEDAPEGVADQTGSVAEDASGMTSWTSADLTENAVVHWRARAFDGNAQNGYSPWSEWETFVVDTTNEAPEAPQVLKPTPEQTVMMTEPRLSSSIPRDPEDDALEIFFEVALDAEFEEVVAASDAVAVSDAASSVEWTTSPELEGDTQYFVHAKAVDEHGAESPWSELVAFRVHKADEPVDPGEGDADDVGHGYDGGGDDVGTGSGGNTRTTAEEGCGCSSSRGAVDMSWLVLIGAGLLGLGARRRRGVCRSEER
jgi:hypothetical protein